MELAKRNFKEMFLDYLSVGLAIAFPPALLLVFQAIPDWLTPTQLTPGIVIFGFAMLTFSSGMILAKDRDSALLSRLLTAPSGQTTSFQLIPCHIYR
jgi:ABC-2 type transport system permease protein